MRGTTLQVGSDVAGLVYYGFYLAILFVGFYFIYWVLSSLRRIEKKLEEISKRLEGMSDGTSGKAKAGQ